MRAEAVRFAPQRAGNSQARGSPLDPSKGLWMKSKSGVVVQLFALFWAQMFANTGCSKLISFFFFLFFFPLRQRVINVLILHSALGAERGLRGRAARRSDSRC